MQEIEFTGDCQTNYLEVRRGGTRGEILQKFCQNSRPETLLETKSNGVFVKFVKEEEDDESSFSATWMASEFKCCNKGGPWLIFLRKLRFKAEIFNSIYLWKSRTLLTLSLSPSVHMSPVDCRH